MEAYCRGTGPGGVRDANTIFVGVHELVLRPHNTMPALRCSERAGGFRKTGTHLILLPHGREREIARADVLARLRIDTRMVLGMSRSSSSETTRSST